MKRFRTWFNVALPLVVIALLLVLDPDSGMDIKVFSPGTTVLLLKILSGTVLVSCAFWTVKVLLDYPEADTRSLFQQVRAGSTSAGLALISRMIMFAVVLYAYSSSAHGAPDVRSYIPAQARTYAPMLRAEQARFWATHPSPELLAGLVEQESCLSPMHSKCWNPASRLKTPREEGAGFGQLTRAYRADGSTRFDALAEMRGLHPELAGLSWDNIYKSPALQLRAMVLKSRDNFTALRVVTAPAARLAMADAAYNGGLGGVQQERRACGLKRGCDAQQWFGNVESVCLKSKAALYGRTACTINREHVYMVMLVRSSKYRVFLAALTPAVVL